MSSKSFIVLFLWVFSASCVQERDGVEGPADLGADLGADMGGAEEEMAAAGPPRLELPAEVRFEVTRYGEVSERVVTLKNSGEGPLRVTALRVVRAAGAEDGALRVEAGQGALPATLEAGQTLEVRVIHEPVSDAAPLGELLVESDDPARPQAYVPIRGEAAPGCIAVTGELDFGAVEVIQRVEREVVIRNCSQRSTMYLKHLYMDDIAGVALDPETTPALLLVDAPRDWRLVPGASLAFKVIAAPSGVGESSGTLRITHDRSALPEIKLDVSLDARPRTCPLPRIELPRFHEPGLPAPRIFSPSIGAPFIMSAEASEPVAGDETPLGYTWSVVSQPAYSGFRFEDAHAAQQEVRLDHPGRYVFELRVAQGEREGCSVEQIVAEIYGDHNVYVMLEWERPAGGSADLDLYYAHPNAAQWIDDRWVISERRWWEDWGVLGNADDDPALTMNDKHGGMGERLNHDGPEANKDYAVGVHYKKAHNAGAVKPKITVYLDSELLYHGEATALREGEFLLVGYVRWLNSGPRFDSANVVTRQIPPMP